MDVGGFCVSASVSASICIVPVPVSDFVCVHFNLFLFVPMKAVHVGGDHEAHHAAALQLRDRKVRKRRDRLISSRVSATN